MRNPGQPSIYHLLKSIESYDRGRFQPTQQLPGRPPLPRPRTAAVSRGPRVRNLHDTLTRQRTKEAVSAFDLPGASKTIDRYALDRLSTRSHVIYYSREGIHRACFGAELCGLTDNISKDRKSVE